MHCLAWQYDDHCWNGWVIKEIREEHSWKIVIDIITRINDVFFSLCCAPRARLHRVALRPVSLIIHVNITMSHNKVSEHLCRRMCFWTLLPAWLVDDYWASWLSFNVNLPTCSLWMYLQCDHARKQGYTWNVQLKEQFFFRILRHMNANTCFINFYAACEALL